MPQIKRGGGRHTPETAAKINARKLRESIFQPLTRTQRADLEIADVRGVVNAGRHMIDKLVNDVDELTTERNILQSQVDDLNAWKLQVQGALAEMYADVDKRDNDRLARYADMLRGWDESRTHDDRYEKEMP